MRMVLQPTNPPETPLMIPEPEMGRIPFRPHSDAQTVPANRAHVKAVS